jgi:hypothetical protein
VGSNPTLSASANFGFRNANFGLENMAVPEMKSMRSIFFSMAVLLLSSSGVIAQSHARVRRASAAAICGNPKVACKTSVTFQPHDLPFRVPANAVILDTEPFYVVILKSMSANNDSCDVFIPETERLAAQALFPDRKVFASRCVEPGELFYTNVNENQRMMAVYAGGTLADGKRVLAAVKATGKFPGANIRRMRTGFNGT